MSGRRRRTRLESPRTATPQIQQPRPSEILSFEELEALTKDLDTPPQQDETGAKQQIDSALADGFNDLPDSPRSNFSSLSGFDSVEDPRFLATKLKQALHYLKTLRETERVSSRVLSKTQVELEKARHQVLEHQRQQEECVAFMVEQDVISGSLEEFTGDKTKFLDILNVAFGKSTSEKQLTMEALQRRLNAKTQENNELLKVATEEKHLRESVEADLALEKSRRASLEEDLASLQAQFLQKENQQTSAAHDVGSALAERDLMADELADLKMTRRELEAELGNAKMKLGKLENQLKAQELQFNNDSRSQQEDLKRQLKREKDKLEKEKDIVSKQLRESQQERIKLAEEMTDAKRKIQTMKADQDMWTERCGRLGNEVKQLQLQYGLQAGKAQFAEQVAFAKTEIERIAEEKQVVQRALRDARHQKQSWKTLPANSNNPPDSNADLEEVLDNFQKNFADEGSEKNSQMITTLLHRVKHRMVTLLNESRGLKADVETLEEEKARLKNQVDGYTEKYNNLSEEVRRQKLVFPVSTSEQSDEKERLVKFVKDYEKEITRLKQELEGAQKLQGLSYIQDSEKEVQDLSESLKKANMLKQVMFEDHKKLRLEKRAVDSLVDNLKKKAKLDREEMERLGEEVEELTKANCRLEAEIEALQTQVMRVKRRQEEEQ